MASSAFHLASLDFAIPAADKLHELTSEQLALLQFHPDSTDALRTAVRPRWPHCFVDPLVLGLKFGPGRHSALTREQAAALFWERRRQDAKTTVVAASRPATPTNDCARNVPETSGRARTDEEEAASTSEGLPATATITNAAVDLVSPTIDGDETSSVVRTASTSAVQREASVTAASNMAVTLSAATEQAGSFSALQNENTAADGRRSYPVISEESTANASGKSPAQPHGSVPSETEPGEVLEAVEESSGQVERSTGGGAGQETEKQDDQAVLDATSPAKKSTTRGRTHKGVKPRKQNDEVASTARKGDAAEGDGGRERRAGAAQPASRTGSRKGADAEPARKRRKTQARARTRSSPNASDAECSCSECEPLSSSTFSSAPSFCSCSGCESSSASSSSSRARRDPAKLRGENRDPRKSAKSSSSRSKKPPPSGERPRDTRLPFKPVSKPQYPTSGDTRFPGHSQVSYDGFSTQQYLPAHGHMHPAAQAALEDEEEGMTRQQLSHLHRNAPTNPAEKNVVTDRTRAMTRSPPRAVKNSYSFPGEPPAAPASRVEGVGGWAGQPQSGARPQQRGGYNSQLSANRGQPGSYAEAGQRNGRHGGPTQPGGFGASAAASVGNSAWGDSPPPAAASTATKVWGDGSIRSPASKQGASAQAVVSSAWDSSPEPEPRGGRIAPANNARAPPAATRPGLQDEQRTNGQASARAAPATGGSWEENQLRLSQQHQQRQVIDHPPAQAGSAWGDSPPADGARRRQNSGFSAPSRDAGWGARRSPTTGLGNGAAYKRSALAGRIGAREEDGPQWGRPRDRDSRYRERSPHSGYDMTPGHGRKAHDNGREREGSREYDREKARDGDRDRERPKSNGRERETERVQEREREREDGRVRYRSRSQQHDRVEHRADQYNAWDS